MGHKPNPLEPGHIQGQNPATPERMVGHTADVPGAGQGGSAANPTELAGRPAFLFEAGPWCGVTLDASGENLPEVDASEAWKLAGYVTLGKPDATPGIDPIAVIASIAEKGFCLWSRE